MSNTVYLILKNAFPSTRMEGYVVTEQKDRA